MEKLIEEVDFIEKLYQCRTEAKGFYHKNYKTKIAPFKDFVSKYCQRSGKDVILGVLEIVNVEEIKQKGDLAVVMFMAAAVELLEEKKVEN